MKKSFILTLIAAGMLLTGCVGEQTRDKERGRDADRTQQKQPESAPGKPARKPAADAVPAGARALMKAYPDFIKGYKEGKLLMSDGSTMLYDDGRKKEFTEMLDNSDPEDMFYVKYTVPADKPEYLADAGRSRCEALFKKMYGSSAAEVKGNLVKVPWFGQTVEFTRVNGAADALKAVAAELGQHPDLRPYLKSSGTFYWRTVRGAKRQSAHSYGIAFDIGVDHSDYWLWKNPGAAETDRIQYANRIPRKIVDIFQRHGFIWGGAWYHYDTMHFEYRPELL
ncbi:MAG: M15 family metallopeptidase [Muribaculaceae bacterium]